MKQTWLAIAIGLTTLAPERLAMAQQAPTFRVQVVGAKVNLTKSDGRKWDGFDAASNTTAENAAKLASMAGLIDGGSTALAAELSKMASSGTEAPDVGGRYELFHGGDAIQTAYLPKIPDTHQPSWSAQALRGVAVNNETRVRVLLKDHDIKNHDKMPQILLDATDLANAYRAGKPVWVSTTEQTGGLVLAVAISVIKEVY